jgi:PPOX class probable F420-dependent enzyme
MLDDDTRALLDGRNFATLATVSRDGSPQSSVVWLLLEGDTVLFSSTADRQKTRNIAADPRVSVTVFDAGNPYRAVEIRGTAEVLEDPEKALPKRLARKYQDAEPPAEPAEVRRVVLRLTPRKINWFGR